MSDDDVPKHINLIKRVIGQMRLQPETVDEAFSEGLVLLVEAQQSFDPSRNVPLATWLAKNISWGLKNWRKRQRPIVALDEAAEVIDHRDIELSGELKEVLSLMDTVLTTAERQVLLGTSLGYRGVELARMMGLTSVGITRLKNSAQRKLREAYNGRKYRR